MKASLRIALRHLAELQPLRDLLQELGWGRVCNSGPILLIKCWFHFVLYHRRCLKIYFLENHIQFDLEVATGHNGLECGNQLTHKQICGMI